jgi:hypothetical protein
MIDLSGDWFPCWDCNGTGQSAHETRCILCEGSGEVFLFSGEPDADGAQGEPSEGDATGGADAH